MRERLKNLKVGKKLQYSFNKILLMFVITIVVAIASILLINMKMSSFYKESYANEKYQLEIRKDVQVVGKTVLWATTTTDETITAQKVSDAETYGDNIATNLAALSENFNNKELLNELSTAASELKTVRTQLLELAAANENEDALALFNGEYNDATEKLQNVLISIGEVADQEAASAYQMAQLLGYVSVGIMVVLGIFCIALCSSLSKTITGSICDPIEELEAAAEKLKLGELDVNITYES